MRRREFIILLGGAAAWPLVVRAQQPAMPLIGFLHRRAPEDTPNLTAAFHQGLKETTAGDAIHQVRVGYQPQDRPDARPRNTAARADEVIE